MDAINRDYFFDSTYLNIKAIKKGFGIPIFLLFHVSDNVVNSIIVNVLYTIPSVKKSQNIDGKVCQVYASATVYEKLILRKGPLRIGIEIET